MGPPNPDAPREPNYVGYEERAIGYPHAYSFPEPLVHVKVVQMLDLLRDTVRRVAYEENKGIA